MLLTPQNAALLRSKEILSETWMRTIRDNTDFQMGMTHKFFFMHWHVKIWRMGVARVGVDLGPQSMDSVPICFIS
jgi:hypothetical protein